MHSQFLASFTEWLLPAGGLVTLIGLIKGLMEFHKSNRIKRAEFLEKLIQEFNNDKLYLAKKILDDFWIGKEATEEMKDVALIMKGSEEKVTGRKDFTVHNLLRDHTEESVTNIGEQKARQSFDDLLDFFSKLDYYLTLRLITKQELFYFIYYIKKCGSKFRGSVLKYAKIYGYSSIFRLLYVLNVKSDIIDGYKESLQFESDEQKRYYQDLHYNS